jgi:hypothetical protein
MYRELSLKITGVAPLILHNGQTADPLNPHSKSIAEITSKRKKTDADHLEVAKREWHAGLYLSGGRVCIPSEMIEANLVNGAKKQKRGPDAKAGIIVEQHATLRYDGPTSVEELWQDERFRIRCPVKVGTSKVIRTRPFFEKWWLVMDVKYLSELLNPQHVISFANDGGMYVGLGDWRPRFGRYQVAEQN